MRAERVIRSCFAVDDSYAEHVTVCALDALRAACGGGPAVILEDGTLATLVGCVCTENHGGTVTNLADGQPYHFEELPCCIPADARHVVPLGES